MKKIESKTIWQSGKDQKATQLQVQGTSVTLGQNASFYWQLLTEEGHQVQSGNLGISGDEYKAWGADDDYVYEIVAKDLGLKIVEVSEEASA